MGLIVIIEQCVACYHEMVWLLFFKHETASMAAIATVKATPKKSAFLLLEQKYSAVTNFTA